MVTLLHSQVRKMFKSGCTFSVKLHSPNSAPQSMPDGRLSQTASVPLLFQQELQGQRGSFCFTSNSAYHDYNSEKLAQDRCC